MQRGFDAILRDYPTTWNLNAYARFACMAQDRATTRQAIQQIGDDIILSAWDDKDEPDWCRTWSGAGKA
jgi:hypothetical protein